MMKIKSFLLAALFAMSAANANAENSYDRPVKAFEFEPFIGCTYGLAGNVGSHQVGPAFGFEARYNLNCLPGDVGTQLYMGSSVNKFAGSTLSFRTFSFMSVCDYDFLLGEKVSPLVGIGIGFNSYDIVQGNYPNDNTDKTLGVGLMPRIGVELFRHVRFTLNAHIGKCNYNTIGLSVGYAFGGDAQ